jgi:HlyD family secretion protein
MRAGEEGMRAAQFAVRAAEFDVEQARAGLLQGRGGGGGGRPVVVPAPISGVVLKRLQESESVVAAGTPLVEIGDLRDLEIVSDLLSTDAVRVKAGARVLVDRWGGDQPLEGRVRRVEPSGFTKISALGVEEQRVNVIVDFADPPEKRPSLGDGYRVEVRIVTAERTDVLKVPTSAIFRRGDQWAAFVVAGDVASMRPIAIGLRSETEVEVSSGLSAGDRVILYPPEGLAEGALVRAATPSARPR